jgi:hypothetical protein
VRQHGDRGVEAYRDDLHGRDLQEDIAGARFCVAINSTALVDATLAGCPCMAFGPSVGINAGVYHPASPATVERDILEMLGGWTPCDDDVDRYLRWLTAVQYSNDELADGTALSAVLGKVRQ